MQIIGIKHRTINFQAKFSVFNDELELGESLGHPRDPMNLEIQIYSHL